MAEKPKKLSNMVNIGNLKQMVQYLTTLDKDMFRLIEYLDRFPRMFYQSAQPDIQNDTFAFWEDSDDSKFYLLWNRAGVTKKVELT